MCCCLCSFQFVKIFCKLICLVKSFELIGIERSCLGNVLLYEVGKYQCLVLIGVFILRVSIFQGNLNITFNDQIKLISSFYPHKTLLLSFSIPQNPKKLMGNNHRNKLNFKCFENFSFDKKISQKLRTI